MRDDGWAEAVAGCDYVIHVASPLPTARAEDRRRTDRARARWRTARAEGGARRDASNVWCSRRHAARSTTAIRLQTAPFDETSWTDIIDGEMSAYVKSKAIAERAAWDFMKAEGGALELSVVNPSGIFGPVARC